MKNTVIAISLMLLMFVPLAAGQTSTPKPAPELKKWNIWVGDWSTTGTAKDTPTGPEYKVNWHTRCHWILDGFALQWDSTWKGNGVESRFLEIGFFDPIKKIHTISGFSNDGTTWTGTVTFEGKTDQVETFTIIFPNGEVSTCRNTWHFTTDGMAVSGTEQCEQNGVSWTGFQGKGTKSKTAK
ncbi:MAG TPA: hypothetical protein VJY15_18870 [Candidatus Acidoferrum sp.]|nr:hypothetical protein [Candidatus Acidoferrum sp.]